MIILLNKHNAGFGNYEDSCDAQAVRSRQACVKNALRVSNLVQDYTAHHGSAYTLVGSALYNITMAATILIADIAEKKKLNSVTNLAPLTTCLNVMKEMEGAEIVARNVRKIVQTIMRVCDVHRYPTDEEHTNTHSDEYNLANVRSHPSSTKSPVIFAAESEIESVATPSCLDPFMFNNVFQFPFEDALLDPYSASQFF